MVYLHPRVCFCRSCFLLEPIVLEVFCSMLALWRLGQKAVTACYKRYRSKFKYNKNPWNILRKWKSFLCPQLRRSWGGILVWACPSVRLTVCPSVRPSVTPYVGCKTRERLELGTWNFIYSISTKNKRTRIFFFGRPLYGKVMPLFRLSHKNLVNTITWERLELGFSYLAYGLGSMFRWPD